MAINGIRGDTDKGTSAQVLNRTTMGVVTGQFEAQHHKDDCAGAASQAQGRPTGDFAL